MRIRTVALLVALPCFVLAIGVVGTPLAQINKPSAAPAPTQPATSSEGASKIDKPSAAPVPADPAPRTDVPSTQPPPSQASSAPVPSRVSAPVRTSRSSPTSLSEIAGSYTVQGTQAVVVVKSLFGDVYSMDSSEGWEGVGILDAHLYRGVFRYRKDTEAAMAGVMGQLLIDWLDPSEPAAEMTFTQGKSGIIRNRWTRIGAVSERPLDEGRPPEFGETVYVEELPEVITRVPPDYPDAARAAHVDGIVQLQVLVVRDGSVRDVRVMKGVSGLDQAAVAAVRQWRFKPALSKGKPVSIWVAVPVRFSLN